MFYASESESISLSLVHTLLGPREDNMYKSFTQVLVKSGIDAGQGINVGPGKFGKKNKRRAS